LGYDDPEAHYYQGLFGEIAQLRNRCLLDQDAWA